MKSSIRPTEPADAPAMGALFTEVGGLLPHLDSRHLQWKYWQPRADWLRPRSFVLARGGELLAHGGIIPGIYASVSRQVSMVQVIDWFARRGEAGAGVSLMKHIGRQTEALLSIGGSADTRRILPHLGFQSVGVATAYVRTMFPSRLLRSKDIPRWRRWPRVVRSLAWTLTAPSSHGQNLVVRRLVGADIDRVSSVLPVPTRAMAVCERSADLFRYITSCPIVPTELYAVENSGVTQGYFLLAYVPGQVRIADCWMNSDEPADWRAMIFCAVDEAKRDSQAAEVVGWASDPLLTRTLLSCGFRGRYEIPVRVRAAADTLTPGPPLRVQMLDSDDFFVHQGQNEFWA